MKKNYSYLIVPAALFAAALLTGCQGHQEKPMTMEEELDSLFQARYPEANEPGAAVLIAKGDSIIYERYFGIADMGTGETVTDSTLFNIASVSKQFTVVGLMQTGVDMNTPVTDHIFMKQYFWPAIKLADLAGHTSGIRDLRDRTNRKACLYSTDADALKYMENAPKFVYAPGTAYMYLNPSYALLAKVIEKKSGQEFTQYQQEHIFDPLGMNSTVYFSTKDMPAHTSHAYVRDEDGQWQEFDYGEENFFGTRPDGGLYTTARDMLRWEDGLANGEVLPDSLLQLAYKPRISVSNSTWSRYQKRPHTWYGLGWFIDDTPGEPVKVYHTGDNGGYQAYVAKYPSEDVRIIVLENRNDQDRWSMAKSIDRILTRGNVLIQEEHK